MPQNTDETGANADVLWQQILLRLKEENPTRLGSIGLVHLLLGEIDQARHAYSELIRESKPAEYIIAHRCYFRILNTLMPKREDIGELRRWFLEETAKKLQ
jgi:hypothetical protein